MDFMNFLIEYLIANFAISFLVGYIVALFCLLIFSKWITEDVKFKIEDLIIIVFLSLLNWTIPALIILFLVSAGITTILPKSWMVKKVF